MEDGASLRVTEDHPRDFSIGELLGGNFAGVGAVALIVDVLGCDLDFGADGGGCEEEVEGGGGDDDLCRWGRLAVV